MVFKRVVRYQSLSLIYKVLLQNLSHHFLEFYVSIILCNERIFYVFQKLQGFTNSYNYVIIIIKMERCRWTETISKYYKYIEPNIFGDYLPFFCDNTLLSHQCQKVEKISSSNKMFNQKQIFENDWCINYSKCHFLLFNRKEYNLSFGNISSSKFFNLRFETFYKFLNSQN